MYICVCVFYTFMNVLLLYKDKCKRKLNHRRNIRITANYNLNFTSIGLCMQFITYICVCIYVCVCVYWICLYMSVRMCAYVCVINIKLWPNKLSKLKGLSMAFTIIHHFASQPVAA